MPPPRRRWPARCEAVRSLEVDVDDVGHWLWLVGNRAGGLIPLELWDFDSWEDLATRQLRVARASGALVQVQFALNFLALARLARRKPCRGGGADR